MDDHISTTNRDELPLERERDLDPVTAELKLEFARLERERREEAFKAIDDAIEMACAPTKPRNQFHNLGDALVKIRRVLDALEQVCLIGIGSSPTLLQQSKFWTAAYKFHREALSRLNALLARSLRATLRVPMFLDGPELSGYKHRLR
jgi:hypothetical protein